MKKSDLKDGMIVELRNKDKCIVVGDRLLDKLSYVDFVSYNDDLICSKKELDVIRVYENDCMCSLSDRYDNEKLKLIWERKDIDWRNVPFGTKVRCWTNDDKKVEGKFLANIEGKGFPFRIYANGHLYAGEYCELIEEMQEEVTFKCIDREMNLYCKWENKRCDKKCDSCGIKYVLQNYNVARKE